MAVPKKRSVALLKSTILNSAQTSHFEVEIVPSPVVKRWIADKAAGGKGNARIAGNDFYNYDLKLACNQASLPGSSLATHEITNKYHNVTVKNPYRKSYDQSASFSFYVDKEYDVIHYFENWMSYIMLEEDLTEDNPRTSYRANYPENYFGSISITKFERDYEGRSILYNFIDAYPESINSMDVSYEGSQVLKCSVNFNYTRYTTKTLLLV